MEPCGFCFSSSKFGQYDVESRQVQNFEHLNPFFRGNDMPERDCFP